MPYFNKTILLAVYIWLTFVPFLSAQKTANTLIGEVYHKMNTIKAYTADAYIEADLPMIKIQPTQASILFNQKDKFKLISKGIVVLPKQGINNLPNIIQDTNSFTAVRSGKETIKDNITDIISIIPNSDTGDVVLAKLWIDPINSLVYKSQITTRENGTIGIENYYKSQKMRGLPDRIVFTVDIKKFKIPKGMTTDINRSNSIEDKIIKDSNTGKIYLTISNYKF